MSLTQSAAVLKLYNAVIDDVIHNVSDSFLDEGVDEQVLQELKQMWTAKMMASKAVEHVPETVDVPPPNVAKSGVLNKAGNRNIQANGTKSKVQRAPVNNTLANSATAAGTSEKTGGGATTSQNTAGSSSSSTAAATSNNSNPLVSVLDPLKLIPIQITLPPQGDAEARVLTIQLPGSVIQNNQLSQMLTAPVIQSIMNLPPVLASSVLQQHVNSTLQNNELQRKFQDSLAAQRQLDGAQDTSDDDNSEVSEENVDGDDDDDLDKDDDEDIEGEGVGAEYEPLNSDDDVTDEDASDLFDTDNVIVCQYDKITRSRNKWKFHLKDGIMNIGGKDFVFQRSNGDAEW